MVEYIVAIDVTLARFPADAYSSIACAGAFVHLFGYRSFCSFAQSISGLVVEYIVAIDVTRARFPADACILLPCLCYIYTYIYTHTYI